MFERACEKPRQAGRHEERQQWSYGHPPLPVRWRACMYVCVCVCLSLFFASVHMTDRGCRRHVYMSCVQAAMVSMRASYSSSHICTHVCVHTRPGPARARGDPCCSRCIMHARMRAAGCHWRPRHMHTHAYACTSTHAKQRGGKGGQRSRHTLDAPPVPENVPAGHGMQGRMVTLAYSNTPLHQ